MLRKMERILLPMRTQVCHDTQHIIQNRSIPADHSALPSSCSEEISGCPDIQSSDPSEMTQIADKLRWYRYRQALLQSEVADRIGIDQKTYMRYEEYGRDYYPIEHMQKLAGMYDVPVESLLDDYSLFLYKGQGKQVLEARKKLKMTQKEFADRLGVQLSALKKWEQDRVKMQKATWEKYFR